MSKEQGPKGITDEFFNLDETDCGRCQCCEQPLYKKGGYAGTGMCGPCATGEAATIDELGDEW